MLRYDTNIKYSLCAWRLDLRTKASYSEEPASFDFLALPVSLCITFSSAVFVVPEGEHCVEGKGSKCEWGVSLHTFICT
jgi:hypothetical protein